PPPTGHVPGVLRRRRGGGVRGSGQDRGMGRVPTGGGRPRTAAPDPREARGRVGAPPARPSPLAMVRDAAPARRGRPARLRVAPRSALALTRRRVLEHPPLAVDEPLVREEARLVGHRVAALDEEPEIQVTEPVTPAELELLQDGV